jgi:tyrosyl-tRNA synthetase
MTEIENMQRDCASGQAHPMKLKQELARRIVADFHSPEAAALAAEGWSKQFQRDEVPENIEEVSVPFSEVSSKEGDGIRLDKLLTRVAMAQSASEASRKIKERAVRVDGEVITLLTIPRTAGTSQTTLTVRLGRKIKRVTLTVP